MHANLTCRDKVFYYWHKTLASLWNTQWKQDYKRIKLNQSFLLLRNTFPYGISKMYCRNPMTTQSWLVMVGDALQSVYGYTQNLK